MPLTKSSPGLGSIIASALEGKANLKVWVARLGNVLYRWKAPYRALYSAYKLISDAAERRVLRDIVRPGMTVVDVGANIGVYAAFLSDLTGPDGRVVAFEPERENFLRLSEQVATRSNVEPVQAAVSDRSGQLKLFVSDSLNVDHRTYDSGEGRDCVTVAAVALDEYFAPGSRVDLIKMDVQGAEASVIRGARRIIDENPGIVLILEFWPYGLSRAGTNSAGLLEHLRSLGFECRLIPDTPDRKPDDVESGINDYVNIVARRPASDANVG